MQRKWQRRWQRLAQNILPSLAAGLLIFSVYNPVYANPAGGTVTSGAATITANGATTTINQTTNKAAINWQSFGIAKGETVRFVQPGSSSVALNRVIGSDASAIYGTLSANGKVFLINPNGVLFAPGSQVNVGGLVASTLSISDSDFLNGNYTFSGSGAGSVVNRGIITAATHAVLIGPQVENEGVIAAQVTGLAAGKQVSLDFSGDKLLNVTVDTGAVGGSAINSGQIIADGGLVVMSAGTKEALLQTVVNNSGVIRAQSVNNVNGVIRLAGNTVANSGTLDTSGKATGQTGGTVKVLGDNITLVNGSSIDVSGDKGGGTALIGGAYQGGGSEYAATNTIVENGATIHADAITSGNGGQVVVWANDTTKFAGTITARGGSVSGNGGSVETSGKKTLKVADTASVNTLAAKGTSGNWLLDPADFTIAASGGDITGAALSANLGSGNVTILSNDGTVNPSGNGDINVNDAISWSSGNTLNLSANRNININAGITANGAGGLTLGAGGTISVPVSVSIGGIFTLTSGTWNQNSASLASFYAKDFRISGGTFIRVKGGDGTSGSPYQIADVYSLQGIGSSGMLIKNYVLANDIAASGTQYWNSDAGFVPIGTYSAAFSGSFDGGGHTIDGLAINRPAEDYIGLFGHSTGAISNVGLTSGSATGWFYVGGLVGWNTGTVTSSYSTRAVTGSSDVGGLVGHNESGTVTNSYSTGAVTGSSSVGGLVGYNEGYSDIGSSTASIKNSYSTGDVTGSTSVGGLVGLNDSSVAGGRSEASIENSYSTGAVTGSHYVGGLVGMNYSYSDGGISTASIGNSYSTGAVTGEAGSTAVGGLVGYIFSYVYDTGTSTASITNSYYATTGETGMSINSGADYNSLGVGKTLAELKDPASFSTWDLAATGGTTSVWRIYAGYTTPLLRSFLTPVTVSAADAAKTYDGAAYSGSAGLVYSLASVNPSLINDSNLTYSGGTNAGTYAITPGGLYSGQQGYDISYASGTLTITPRPITVTAGNQSRVYGDANPASGAVNITNGSLAGSDSINGAAGVNSPATAGSHVGDYALTASGVTFTSGNASNYSITYANGTLTITPRPITVTAGNQSRVYGDTNPASGAVNITNGSLAGSDSINGTASVNSPATAGSHVGDYALTASGVTFASGNASNYSITYANGTLTITPRPITITASNASRYFGGANPAFTYAISGLTNGDALADVISSLVLTTPATSISPSGSYAITPGGTPISSNYTVSFLGGVLTVSRAPWQEAGYTGAVGPAAQVDFTSPGRETGSLLSGYRGLSGAGYLNNTTGGVLPLTVIEPGINLSGLTPLTDSLLQ